MAWNRSCIQICPTFTYCGPWCPLRIDYCYNGTFLRAGIVDWKYCLFSSTSSTERVSWTVRELSIDPNAGNRTGVHQNTCNSYPWSHQLVLWCEPCSEPVTTWTSYNRQYYPQYECTQKPYTDDCADTLATLSQIKLYYGNEEGNVAAVGKEAKRVFASSTGSVAETRPGHSG